NPVTKTPTCTGASRINRNAKCHHTEQPAPPKRCRGVCPIPGNVRRQCDCATHLQHYSNNSTSTSSTRRVRNRRRKRIAKTHYYCVCQRKNRRCRYQLVCLH